MNLSLLAHLSPVPHAHSYELGALLVICSVAMVIWACRKQTK
jgi:hypothetical protein